MCEKMKELLDEDWEYIKGVIQGSYVFSNIKMPERLKKLIELE